ncbi:MAG TPA: hypothetical protein PK294_12740 [Ignavibacteria bacterium]|nr:hypothetical protein [Ignavibacteria bacterium]
MTFEELDSRLDTILSITSWALLTKERYNIILKDKKKFEFIFPDTNFENLRITNTVENFGVLTESTKNEFLNSHNHDLYKAWQVALGIIGMSAILESFLKQTAEKITGENENGTGIFKSFSKKTKIKIEEISEYFIVNKFYQVRHIIIHNLGRVDFKLSQNIDTEIEINKPYIFYPMDLKIYKDAIIGFSQEIIKNTS